MNFYLLFYLYAKTILPISIVSISWAEIFESNYKNCKFNILKIICPKN